MGYRLIVFDWDGTLMDSAAKIVACFQKAARDVGVVEPEAAAIRKVIGLGLERCLQILFPEAANSKGPQLIERYREHFHYRDETEMPLFSGVRDGLRGLAEQGYWLAVATGKARRGLDRALDESRTREFFIASRCADEALPKPHPRMLEDVLRGTGVSPAEAVMVGDTTYDMQMARSAGVAPVGVTYGVHSAHDLAAYAPLACLDSFTRVCAWVDQRLEQP